MKRPFFLLTLFLLNTVAIQAKPITREQARERAEKFLKACPGSKILSPIVNRTKLAPRRGKAIVANESELYYVFNRGSSQGYVIVSGDDQTLPVLGYTDSGEFDYNKIPDNMRSWLDGYEKELQYIAEHPETVANIQHRIPTHDAIPQFLFTTWNQSAPFNNACPEYFSLGRSVTGCVATAMAQCLYHQRAKSVTEIQADIPAYNTSTTHATYGNLHVEGIPQGSVIDWDNMLESYSSSNERQRQAVANLMHYCGVSVEMDYTNSSSGAYIYKIAEAMTKYFGYGSSVRHVSEYGYTEESWDALIYGELAQGRVVCLSGQNSQGGHAFVTCGYDGNHLYYINWGWGGASNGFFLLSSLNPSSQGIGGTGDGYSQMREAIIGIEPENYGTKAIPIENATVKSLCISHFDANGDGVFTFGEAAAVTSIGDVFKGSRITTFPELYNFTGLTEISDSAFYGCTSLTTVRLPKGLKSIGAHAFEKCAKLKNINLPDGVTHIDDNAFTGCKVLVNPQLPTVLSQIGAHAFEGCLALTELNLFGSISHIGDEAYSGCTKLQCVKVQTIRPQDITLGTSVFKDIDLTEAELNIVQGTKEYFTTTEQWKDFGHIIQLRNLAQGKFMELTTNKNMYLYNIGTGRYLTKGEAWGTQAIVADTDDPMRFQLRHTSAMPEGVYALYSPDTGNERHYLFRTTTDENVGAGIKACFVDKASVTTSTYWQVTDMGDNIYTLQVPSTQSDYVEGQFWGIQPTHDSNAASPTYGVYSDIEYANYAKNCQWMFVEYDANRTATYLAAKTLGNLLSLANKKRLDTAQEQAIYDDFDSDIATIKHAQSRLRKKLNFINFKDENVYSLAVATWDVDGNGEISTAEAAAAESLGSNFYGNTTIVSFDEFKNFTYITQLYGNSFLNCSNLTSITLPASLTTIYYRAFMGCRSLTSISLPEHVTSIGDDVFNNCTSLTEVRIANPNPSTINVKSSAFPSAIAKKATLYVPLGTKESYAAAPVWKDFGTILEMRPTTTTPAFSPIATGEKFYVMNLGSRLFLNKGEAYGSQSVVGLKGLKYELRRNNNTPDSVFNLYCDELTSNNKTLFRTSTDSKVGNGVKACFVDGAATAKSTFWKFTEVGENIYTLQVPTNDAEYVENEFLGIQSDHDSECAYPTYGCYYDIEVNGNNELNCQWAFISEDDMEKAQTFDDNVLALAQLISRAEEKEIDATAEKAVYDDFDSTPEQVKAAIQSLRTRLHYIDFCDVRARTICLNAWDNDNDDELSLEEAAAVTDLGTRFASLSSVHSVDELRFFTALTTIPDIAFRRNTGIVSVYVPAGVTTMGTEAYSGCSALKYMAILNPSQVVNATVAELPKALTVFVPANMIEAYQADEIWGKHTIREYTGIPTVVPDSTSRQYGRANPSKHTFVVLGAPINGEPTFTDHAEATSPVGEYPITVETGSNTSFGFTSLPGVLTVVQAPLTITAKSYTRNKGEENPEFELTYRSFRNKENYEVLLQQPTIQCDATPDSPGGVYEIRVFGAEAQNYEISYVNGTLTVIDPDGISGIDSESLSQPVYDLQGRRVGDSLRLSTLPKGIYVVGGNKIAVK